MALEPPLRKQLQALRRGEHSRGIGLCPECRMRPCPGCGKTARHLVGSFGFSEEVCENGCTKLERSGFVLRFQAEMKEALYQLEKEEQERKH